MATVNRPIHSHDLAIVQRADDQSDGHRRAHDHGRNDCWTNPHGEHVRPHGKHGWTVADGGGLLPPTQRQLAHQLEEFVGGDGLSWCEGLGDSASGGPSVLMVPGSLEGMVSRASRVELCFVGFTADQPIEVTATDTNGRTTTTTFVPDDGSVPAEPSADDRNQYFNRIVRNLPPGLLIDKGPRGYLGPTDQRGAGDRTLPLVAANACRGVPYDGDAGRTSV